MIWYIYIWGVEDYKGIAFSMEYLGLKKKKKKLNHNFIVMAKI